MAFNLALKPYKHVFENIKIYLQDILKNVDDFKKTMISNKVERKRKGLRPYVLKKRKITITNDLKKYNIPVNNFLPEKISISQEDLRKILEDFNNCLGAYNEVKCNEAINIEKSKRQQPKTENKQISLSTNFLTSDEIIFRKELDAAILNNTFLTNKKQMLMSTPIIHCKRKKINLIKEKCNHKGIKNPDEKCGIKLDDSNDKISNNFSELENISNSEDLNNYELKKTKIEESEHLKLAKSKDTEDLNILKKSKFESLRKEMEDLNNVELDSSNITTDSTFNEYSGFIVIDEYPPKKKKIKTDLENIPQSSNYNLIQESNKNFVTNVNRCNTQKLENTLLKHALLEETISENIYENECINHTDKSVVSKLHKCSKRKTLHNQETIPKENQSENDKSKEKILNLRRENLDEPNTAKIYAKDLPLPDDLNDSFMQFILPEEFECGTDEKRNEKTKEMFLESQIYNKVAVVNNSEKVADIPQNVKIIENLIEDGKVDDEKKVNRRREGIDEDDLKDMNHPHWSLHKFSTPQEIFQIISKQWRSLTKPFPHNDLTCRYKKKCNIEIFAIRFIGKDNLRKIPCKNIFNETIKEHEKKIRKLNKDINLLYQAKRKKPYNFANQRLHNYLNEKVILEEKIFNLENARDEIEYFFSFYNDENLNAACLTDYEEFEIKKQQDVFSLSDRIYGPQ